MARMLNRLSASKVATAKGPHTYSDGGHMYLTVDVNNNRRWIFLYAKDGRQREISLDAYPALSLADARKKRDAMNVALANGEPLAGPRQKDAAPTFGSVSAEVIKRRAKAWRGGVSAQHWKVSIEQHCQPLLTRPIASITQEDVLRILRPLHDRAPNFAAITRARVEDVFTYAQASGLLPLDRANPADRRRLKLLLPATPKAVPRPALAYADVPALMAELREINIADKRVVAARALEFTILTALRVQEACDSTLSEFDFDKRIFAIPAARMKVGKEHVVPLSNRAIAIVRELDSGRGGSGVVFPAWRMKPIKGERLNALLGTLCKGVTVHGFRSSFRDWCGDCTTYPREVAEAALAHTIGGVEGAYRRSSALEKRRQLMEQWARFCGGEEQESGKLIALRAG
jgi:integrase